MNHDITLLSKASQPVARPLPPDIRDLREHIGTPAPRSIRLRQSISSWLYQLAERIAPRPARTEHDELFEAISALLAEPSCDLSPLNSASHGRC